MRASPSSWPGYRPGSRCAGASAVSRAAAWASGTCHPRCWPGRSRGSRHRSCTSWATKCAGWRRGCCSRARSCGTGICAASGWHQLVEEHLEGRRDHGNRIWLLLTAEALVPPLRVARFGGGSRVGAGAACGRRGVGGGERVAGWGNGVGEIRTHEGVAPLAVFKTAAFNHSATTPGAPKALWASGHRQVGSARSCIPDAVSCGVRNRR